jgi:lipopolysaccharide export system permease protein
MLPLGDVGRLDPRIALWGMVLLFAAFSIGIFRHSNGHPNEGAFDGALDWLDRLAEAAARHLPRRRRLPG